MYFGFESKIIKLPKISASIIIIGIKCFPKPNLWVVLLI